MNNFEICVEIKEAFKKQKFRWLKVENKITEQSVKMYLRINPGDKEEEAIKSMKNKSILEIRHSVIVQLKHCSLIDEIPSARINYKEENAVNIFPLLYSLSELVNKEKYFLQTDKFNFNKIVFDKLKVKKL